MLIEGAQRELRMGLVGEGMAMPPEEEAGPAGSARVTGGPAAGVLQGVEWFRDKQKVDNDENVWHHFYAPTSFPMDPVSASMFKQQAKEAYEPRTEITLFGGVGYKLQAFSVHPDEAEVLVEPVCSCAITRMQDFSGHAHEIPGETTDALQGLHRIELRVKPGIRYAICAHTRLRARTFMILARLGADLLLHQSPNS